MRTPFRSLGSMTDEDALTALSLESRRDELRQTLATLVDEPETLASAALFFSGRPVVANRGIETEFGAGAIDKFQDVVTTMFALRSTGVLGQRGAVPGKDLAKLHITNVVHGDRKSTRLNSSHLVISYAVFCLKKKKKIRR